MPIKSLKTSLERQGVFGALWGAILSEFGVILEVFGSQNLSFFVMLLMQFRILLGGLWSVACTFVRGLIFV